jgi:hypothetical protein
MIVIDGEQFKIDVLSVKRSADFLDKYAERLANGHLRLQLQAAIWAGAGSQGIRPTVGQADRACGVP